MKKCYKVILLYNHDYHQLKIGSEEMIKKLERSAGISSRRFVLS